jgi:riboflavin kinase/FMN adenylyltransferase
VDVRTYSYPEKLNIKGTAVALGYFDGVHVGHRELISLLVREAKAKKLKPYVFTFVDDLAKTKKTQSIIYNTEEKLKIFASLGVEGVIIANFSSISGLTPEEFVGDVLVDAIGAELAISGYNFRFGKFAAAGSSELIELMEAKGKGALVLSEQKIDGKPLSATVIRQLIADKNLDAATKMLGIPYFIEGTVEKGLGLGKVYGFPTVNLPLRQTAPLPSGVYRTAVEIGKKLYTGITNVGSCPTVCEREIHTETLIADFSGDLYGKTLRIYFLGYLREERRFDSVDELREQIYLDRDKSIEENGDLKWLEIGLSLQ